MAGTIVSEGFFFAKDKGIKATKNTRYSIQIKTYKNQTTTALKERGVCAVCFLKKLLK
jgi:hypothetical protein